MVFFGMIMGFIMSKEDKLLDLRKSKPYPTCMYLSIYIKFKFLMVWHNYINVLLKALYLLWFPLQNYCERYNPFG